MDLFATLMRSVYIMHINNNMSFDTVVHVINTLFYVHTIECRPQLHVNTTYYYAYILRLYLNSMH